jgi:hypothetical protein
MIYYTIFVKGLNNSTGYIDVALADDQLLRDFMQYLDVGIKPHRTYTVTTPPKAQGTKQVSGSTGVFAINLSDVTAITALRTN